MKSLFKPSLSSFQNLPNVNWNELIESFEGSGYDEDFGVEYAMGLISKGEFIARLELNAELINDELDSDYDLICDDTDILLGSDIVACCCDTIGMDDLEDEATWSISLNRIAL